MTSIPTPQRQLKVELRKVDSLRPRPNNPRTHNAAQIQQIARSIERFGFCNAVLIDDDGGIIAGHGRILAAVQLGMDEVPAIRLTDMTADEIRAYVIADNKLALNAGWDTELLGIELQYLSDIDIDIDVAITGFEVPEIDILISGLSPVDDPAADVQPDVDPDSPTPVQPGDLWLLGRHRLLCGNATKPEDVAKLMAGEQAQMVFVDPPYNVPIDGHVCGLGRIKHAEFAMAAGEMSVTEFTAFLTTTLGHLAEHSVDGSIHFVCMDWRHLPELLDAGGNVYDEIKNLCVWAKTNAGMGSLYRSQHELVAVFKNGATPHINNVELGRHGRSRSNVWTYAGVNTFGGDRLEALASHPTVKPVALVADAILDCSTRDGIVLDTFAGSGTTIIAAEKTGRRAYTLELDPKYVEVAINRYQTYTGDVAIHAATGRTWAEYIAQYAEANDV